MADLRDLAENVERRFEIKVNDTFALATTLRRFKTVEKHRQHLMQKLNIHDTAGITRYAVSAGIIESSVQVTIV